MSVAIERLARALEFLEACRSEPGSVENGAMRDAHEWLEEAARAAVAEMRDPVTCYYIDRDRGGHDCVPWRGRGGEIGRCIHCGKK